MGLNLAQKIIKAHLVGGSMEPLLHNRKSTVLIAAGNTDLQKYDVVLFHRPGGAYVLHRIRRIRGTILLVCGDNRVGLEKVPREWVLGKMTGYYPDEGPAFITCSDPEYQAYLKSLTRRYCGLWIRLLPKRIKRKAQRLFSGES